MTSLFRKWLGFILGVALVWMVHRPLQADESTFIACAPHNTATEGEVIVLGKVNAPYVVAVPLQGDSERLNQVRQCIPDAFQTESSQGQYIHAGAFSRYAEARQLARYLNQVDLDARILFLP